VKRTLLAVLAVAVLVAGCGGDDETTPAETTDVRVYWLSNDDVWPAARAVEETEAVAEAALDELLAGPTEQEQADLGFTTAIPEGTTLDGVTIEDGVATVSLSAELADEALAQVVYTVTQFPSVESVDIQGRELTRADFEEQTPPVLVESPLPFEDVTSPVRATGTANTFEANFNYELTDTDGRIVDENFVTATSGTGTRGTFDFTTDEFTVPFDGIGSLIVFEFSAEDGSRIHIVEIPLKMTK
jgi:hypothetical protein